ncbi:hypothetical protein [Zobellia galactanivorans]|uniref:hypothetical protein n=1 Tax=Zobellia galactanivorans (strain DSM 12802 / CCUG 47099 / CIP 106680 / NCIMB 13871 / Dsij) TaxID=63186 RepID=UPI001C07951C|nr:hypothetical protein [Zobellia galactanivorans]MBU3024053.1 hypothetical protein [Zobellia galactanivorans]
MKIVKVKGFVLLLFVILGISCQETKGWSEDDKNGFLKGCIGANNGKVSEEKANELCSCILDKMMENYPTMIESQKMGVEDIKALAETCQ